MRREPANWPPSEQLITTRQLGHLLSVTPATVRRWKTAGTGPPAAELPPGYPCGKQTLYRCADVKEWAVGNVRPSKHWKGLTTDPEHDLDDYGRAILAAANRAMIGATMAERQPGGSAFKEAARLRRKLTSRARYLAGAGTNPGAFEEQLTRDQLNPESGEVIDAEFEEQAWSGQQSNRVPQVIKQPLVKRPGQPVLTSAPMQSREHDRQLLEELLATPRGERPAF
jgi:hypothetical protein